MEQKNLTELQMTICKELKALIDKAENAGIKFVFDQSDYLLSAYNGDGIDNVESNSNGVPYGCEKFNFAKTFDITYPDYVNSTAEYVYIVE
jgi:hypothetical protein